MNRATAAFGSPVEALPADKPVKTLQTYAQRIQALVPGQDPRHVEAFMRLEHSTLDGLSTEAFRREALVGAECVRQGGLEFAERTARSFGL